MLLYKHNLHLVKLFCHFANNVGVFHVMVHVSCNATTAPRTVDKKLYEFKQCSITILLVCLDPFINNSLATQCKVNLSHKISSILQSQQYIISYR